MADQVEEAISLKEHVEVLIANLEKRLTEVQRGNELAVAKATDASERAITKATEASDRALTKATEVTDKAIIKAEEANNKRLDGLNEFRLSLADQTKEYATRAAIDAVVATFDAKLEGQRVNYETKIDALWKFVYALATTVAVIQAIIQFAPTK